MTMEQHSEYMKLKVLLPYRVFLETENVKRMVAETTNGSYGFLPHRLDCSAKLRPGIFMYETMDGEEHFLAMDEGIFVKTGMEVTVSSRRVVGGTDLGKLHETVEQEFMELDENERSIRAVMAKLEVDFIQSMEKMRKGQSS